MRAVLRDEEGRPFLAHRYARYVGRRGVELRFALVDGRLVCIGLQIGPSVFRNEQKQDVFAYAEDEDLDPLRSAEIRLPLRELVDEALQSLIAQSEELAAFTGFGVSGEEVKVALAPLVAGARGGRKKPGRPAIHDDEHYKRVAAIYEETLRSGRRDPLQAIMRELKIEKTAAASKVREARRRGFLTMDYFTKPGADDAE